MSAIDIVTDDAAAVTPTSGEPESTVAPVLEDVDLEDVEESLIEEISIDGMCGVY